MTTLSPHEETIAAALSAAALPPGRVLPGGGAATVERLREWLARMGPVGARGVKALLWVAETAPIPFTGRPLSALPREQATGFLERWQASDSYASRALLHGILTPIKAAHFDDAQVFASVGCPSPANRLPVRDERSSWMARVIDGRRTDEDLDLECEVVVVGTGAGGAACAYELASRGHAVLLLEEGDYHRRSSFTAHAVEMSSKLYRDHGLTMALGNVGIPIWAGRAVGGTTLINSGTCYRAPERTFERWREELGLTWFTSDAMAPYYEKVEAMLEVELATMALAGGVGRVVARGASRLGMKHGTLRRCAPGCDGQGMCCFGCPTGAKRSTDVSYVPAALKKGAQLITAARVSEVRVEGGCARGVYAELGSGKTLRVRSSAVVLAAGAMMTPVLIQKTRLLASREVGRNLTIHPATKVMAVFEEKIDMVNAIPQGYFVEHPNDPAIVFEGASLPLDVAALAVPWVGPKFVEFMEQYPHVAMFGFMIEDSSRGRVRPGPNGSPLVTYNMSATDLARMKDGIATLSDIFFAAGAKRVLPLVHAFDELFGPGDVARLRAATLAHGDFEVSAYHALGTCRMGRNPHRSVVGPDHETHEVEALYIADGSVVSGPLGVNPMMTIMATALRAAEIISSRLS